MKLFSHIQSDQKVSAHLTITIEKEVHRDFLITLYFNSNYGMSTLGEQKIKLIPQPCYCSQMNMVNKNRHTVH